MIWQTPRASLLAGMVSEVADILPEIAPGMQQFGIEIISVLTQKLAARLFRFTLGVTPTKNGEQALPQPTGSNALA